MRAMLRERGQTSAEYVGVILVVAAVIALVATSSIGEAVTTKLTCAIQGIGGGAGCGGTAPGEGAPTPAENGAAPQEGGPPPAEPSAAPLEAEAPAESPPEEEDDDDGGFGGFVSDAWNGTTDAVGDLGTGAWNGTKALGGELWDTTKGIGRHIDIFHPSDTWQQWKETGGTAKYAVTHPWESTKAVAGSFVDPIKEAYEHGGIPEALGRGTIDAVGAVFGGKGLTKLGKLNRVDDAVPDPLRARDTTPDGDATPDARRDRADVDCSNSFTAETPVLLADGTKRAIAAVAVGDRVLASDPGTGATGARAVERVIVGEGRKVLVRVRVSGEVLTATDHHPVWVDGRGTFVDAEDLRPGERLRRPDGSLASVESVRVLPPENERVYNLTAADRHTYYAGEAPVLVHNAGGCATFGRATSKDYKATFFEQQPELRGKVVVHHAVEQQVQRRYPGVVSDAELHSLENLRGIPKDANPALHLSRIRRSWNEFYRQHPTATQEDLLEHATTIDRELGREFTPPAE